MGKEQSYVTQIFLLLFCFKYKFVISVLDFCSCLTIQYFLPCAIEAWEQNDK